MFRVSPTTALISEYSWPIKILHYVRMQNRDSMLVHNIPQPIVKKETELSYPTSPTSRLTAKIYGTIYFM